MLAASHVDVWLARESQLQDATWLERLRSALTADERAQVEAPRAPEVRDQRLITRALARLALSHYLPAVSPVDWRFERSALGRPAIAADMPAEARALQFNLANTQGLVVMAVGRLPEIGVDVERITAQVQLAVARRYFSAAEIAAMDALPAIDRPRHFLRLWTLKEAYLKAVGTGIGGGLASMSFDFGAAGPGFQHEGDPHAARWQFHEFTVDDRYLLALACLDRESSARVCVRLRDFSGQE